MTDSPFSCAAMARTTTTWRAADRREDRGVREALDADAMGERRGQDCFDDWGRAAPTAREEVCTRADMMIDV